MNIESANLSSLVASGSIVESTSRPLTDSNGFSGALVAQIGLLGNAKAGVVQPLPTSDLAGLLGNELPASYKINDHEAVLGAVTDTLKYITMGTSAGEKAAAAEQNIKNLIAMAVPAQQNVKMVTATVVPVEQNTKIATATVIFAQQNVKTTAVVPVEQTVKAATATVVPTQQNVKTATVIPVEQNVKVATATVVPVE